ncbi:MAG: hypothetical protein V4515_00735 [Chloroflexota bacterium]
MLTAGGNQRPDSLGVVGDIPNRVVSGLDQDVPCTENADGVQTCATPLPKLTTADKASASALIIENGTVKLDHLGKYRVFLGQVVLARGIVQSSVLELGNVRSETYLAPSFRLELEDASSHRVLPRNIYDKGITDGPQRVDAYLVFDLQWYQEGASILISRVEVN